MAKNDIFLYAILAAGAAYWYFKMNGKATIDDLLGGLKGGSQVNTGANVSGDVQSMLQNMGVDMNVNNGSGQNIKRTRQVDTTGHAKQTQTHSQKSNVFYTIPRFGNL